MGTQSVDPPPAEEKAGKAQHSTPTSLKAAAPRPKNSPLDPRRGPGRIAGERPSAEPEEEGAAPQPARRSLGAGIAVIREALKTVTGAPGVYRMLDRKGEALYVGKAKNLKSRVQNYTHGAGLSNRLARMIAETAALEVVVTATEAEALLLECNMIKRLMPRFNVLLRDDKSFPLIHITGDRDFPQISKHRGAKSGSGSYFGPFASAGAVNRTLVSLQKAFLLRSCSDSVFASRTRPCLLYQIKRCSAPCVGRISREDYARLIGEARAFLSGKSGEVQERLALAMEEAAKALDFERAALYRDRIRALSLVQGHQDIHVAGIEEADVIAAHQAGGQTSIQVFFFRGGQNWGNRAYFPSHDRQMPVEEVLTAFIGQFYEGRPKPPLILSSHPLIEQSLVEEALSLKGGRVQILVPRRGAKKKLVERILASAREALGRRLAESASQRQLIEGLAAAFALEAPPNRIEVYDNSHIQGSDAVGAMIVAGPEGFNKNAYRQFTIRRSAPSSGGAQEAGGDDYAMLREVLERRFARALKEDPERRGGTWPDLVLIDGGHGQLHVAESTLQDLGIGDVALAAIAKGPDRDAGRERFFLPGRAPFRLEPRDPVLYFLQRLRDEAHRFAIGTHRARRTKALARSALDEIPGIGAKRKQALLRHFGSARAVARAGLAELLRVEGISNTVAKKLYDHFRPDA
jgi:excinuclease ABC subunit C